MSLRFAILTALVSSDKTGYDLSQVFREASITSFWTASQSQIYPELRKMEEEGLITATVAPRGQRAEKRIYSITDKGTQELHRLAREMVDYAPESDPVRLKAYFFELVSFDDARAHLRAHIAHYQSSLERWQDRIGQLRARGRPQLENRLKRYPDEEHEAVIEYKIFGLEGQVARARAEIEWARRGLALIDRLEADRRDAEESARLAAIRSSRTGTPGLREAEPEGATARAPASQRV